MCELQRISGHPHWNRNKNQMHSLMCELQRLPGHPHWNHHGKQNSTLSESYSFANIRKSCSPESIFHHSFHMYLVQKSVRFHLSFRKEMHFQMPPQ